MLSRSAEYALRIMAYLALEGDGKPIRAKEIAHGANIPLFYLSKVLRRMVLSELLVGARGHGGGFRIAKAHEEIRFIDILTAIEGSDVCRRTCVFGWDACSDDTPCALHDRWSKARESFDAWATSTTLADIKADFTVRSPLLEAGFRPEADLLRETGGLEEAGFPKAI